MDKQERILAAEAQMKAKDAPAEPAKAEAEPVTPEPKAEPEPAKVEAEPAAPQEEEDEGDSAPPTDDPAAPHPKNKGVGKRINELTKEKHEERRAREQAEAAAAYWQQEAQRIAQLQPQPVQQQPLQGEPTLEQFGYDQAKYDDARFEYRLNRKLAERDLEAQRRQEQQRQQQIEADFQKRIADFELKQPGGWDAVRNAPLNTTPPMVGFITNSPVGPDVAYYLQEHLDEANAISQMPPFQAVSALARIETKFSAPAPQTSPPSNITRAPPPPATVKAGSTAIKPLESWTLEDHARAVRDQKIAKHS